MTSFRATDFFKAQKAISSANDLLAIPAVTSSPLEIRYDDITADFRDTSQEFGKIFGSDYSLEIAGAEAISPLTHRVLKAMNEAGCDLPAFSYDFFVSTRYVVPDGAIHGVHTDGNAFNLKTYQSGLTSGQNRYMRAVISNVCPTAVLPPASVCAKCPEGIDPGFFYASVLEIRRRAPYFDTNLDESGIVFPAGLTRNAYIEKVEQTYNKITDTKKNNWSRVRPSSPVYFNFATLHALTCRTRPDKVGEQFTSRTPGARRRHLVIMTISPKG